MSERSRTALRLLPGLVVCGLVVCVIAAGGNGSEQAAWGSGSGRMPAATDGSPEERLRQAVATRAEFGLRNDEAYVRAVALRKDVSTSALGVPLTPAETREIENREALGTHVGRIAAEGESSEWFGGVRVDQAAGGVIVIELVGEGPATDALKRRLRALLPPAVTSTVVRVAHSYLSLREAEARIGRDLAGPELRALGVTMLSWTGQTLEIGLHDDAPADAEQRLRARYAYPFLVITRGVAVEFQDD